MSTEWQYQVRIHLDDAVAETARFDPGNPALKPLTDILARHGASMKSQFDAFAEYVAEAERHGRESYPLYEWTKATIRNPEKAAKHTKSFTIYTGGREVYDKAVADALEADLRPLVGGQLVRRMTKHDTNPANNPQPPERFRR